MMKRWPISMILLWMYFTCNHTWYTELGRTIGNSCEVSQYWVVYSKANAHYKQSDRILGILSTSFEESEYLLFIRNITILFTFRKVNVGQWWCRWWCGGDGMSIELTVISKMLTTRLLAFLFSFSIGWESSESNSLVSGLRSWLPISWIRYNSESKRSTSCKYSRFETREYLLD